MDPATKRFRHTCLLLATACLVLAAGRLQAGESPWYVAARFGESSAEAQLGQRHPQRVDDEASTASIELGHEVNRYLAVEAGYHDLGSHAGVGSPCRQNSDCFIERLAALGLCAEGFDCTEIAILIDVEISGLSLALVPRLPLGERLSLRGKLGILSWDGEVTAASLGTIERFSGENLVAGVGLEYSFPSGLGILAQHEELDLDGGATSIGMRWRF